MSRTMPLLIFDNSDDEDWSPEKDDLTPPPSRKKQRFYQYTSAMREVTPEWENIARPGQTEDSPSVARSQRAGKREASSLVAERLDYTTDSPIFVRAQRTPKTAPKDRKLPVFRWSKDMRLAVHLLVTKFHSDWPDAEAIFNKLFEEELSLCGKLDGIGRIAMRQQYSPAEKRKQYWVDVLKHELSPSEVLGRERMIREIKRVKAQEDPTLLVQPSDEQKWRRSVQIATAERHVNPRRNPMITETSTSRIVRRSYPLVASSSSPAQRLTPPSTPPNRTQRSVLPLTPLSSTRKPASVAAPFGVQELAPTARTVFNSISGPLTPAMGKTLITRKRTILDVQESISTPNSDTVLFNPVSQEQAHPRLPSLLFRYYDEGSIGINGSDGFQAGMFIYETLGFPPSPACTDPIIFHYVENHINMAKIASPFISVSTSFYWAVRHAAKRVHEGIYTGRIAMINSEIASANDSAFAVPPYHRPLKDRRAFYHDKCRYNGSYEQLIWARIPRSAIVHDFSLDELKMSLSRYPAMTNALKLDILYRGPPAKKLDAMMKERPVKLGSNLASDLAAMLLLLNIDVTMPERISDLVSDFCIGWKIDVDKDTPGRWELLGGTFVYALTNRTRDVTLAQMQWAKEAFIQGISSGIGGYNWQKKDNTIRAQKRKAESLGLPPVERREKRFLLDRVEIPMRPKDDLAGYQYVTSYD